MDMKWNEEKGKMEEVEVKTLETPVMITPVDAVPIVPGSKVFYYRFKEGGPTEEYERVPLHHRDVNVLFAELSWWRRDRKLASGEQKARFEAQVGEAFASGLRSKDDRPVKIRIDQMQELQYERELTIVNIQLFCKVSVSISNYENRHFRLCFYVVSNRSRDPP